MQLPAFWLLPLAKRLEDTFSCAAPSSWARLNELVPPGACRADLGASATGSGALGVGVRRACSGSEYVPRISVLAPPGAWCTLELGFSIVLCGPARDVCVRAECGPWSLLVRSMQSAPPGEGRARSSWADRVLAMLPWSLAKSMESVPPGAVLGLSSAAATASALPAPRVLLSTLHSAGSAPRTIVAAPVGWVNAGLHAGGGAPPRLTESAPPMGGRTQASAAPRALVMASALPTPTAWLSVFQSAPSAPSTTLAGPATDGRISSSCAGRPLSPWLAKSRWSAPPTAGRARSSSADAVTMLALPKSTVSAPPGAVRTRGSAAATASALPAPLMLLFVNHSVLSQPSTTEDGPAPFSLLSRSTSADSALPSSWPNLMESVPPHACLTLGSADATASALPTPWLELLVSHSLGSMPRTTEVLPATGGHAARSASEAAAEAPNSIESFPPTARRANSSSAEAPGPSVSARWLMESVPPGAARVRSSSFDARAACLLKSMESNPPGAVRSRGVAEATASMLPTP
mmetsp:Transcript_12134/g.36041  ORF Transcript_12134/g.36041 Transcript_12134/m.36041 type:complete len:520 (-) Transcript_12134:760-2319(-)